MKTILILPNNFTLENIKKNIDLFDDKYHLKNNPNDIIDLFKYDEFKINNFCKELDYNNDEFFMENIIREMIENDKYLSETFKNIAEVDAENLWGECKLIQDINNMRYEIIYMDDKIFKGNNENHLGSLLTKEQIGVFGPCVIIGTESNIENTDIKHKMVNIEYETIFRLLINKMISKGIILYENKMEEVYISSTKSILNDIDIKYYNDNFIQKINGIEYLCYYNNYLKEYVNLIGTKFFVLKIMFYKI
jgi:hypothetical protein